MKTGNPAVARLFAARDGKLRVVHTCGHAFFVFPEIVQYEIDGVVLDHPPTKRTHPDEQRTHRDGATSLPYRTIVHNLEAYVTLRAGGWLRDLNAELEPIDARKVVA